MGNLIVALTDATTVTAESLLEEIIEVVDFTVFLQMFSIVAVVAIPTVLTVMAAKKGVKYVFSWLHRAA